MRTDARTVEHNMIVRVQKQRFDTRQRRRDMFRTSDDGDNRRLNLFFPNESERQQYLRNMLAHKEMMKPLKYWGDLI